MPTPPTPVDTPRMWLVTTHGDLPDDEQRVHDASAPAWDDYHGRILELEIAGFARDGEESSQYGRRWEYDLSILATLGELPARSAGTAHAVIRRASTRDSRS
jgi:hypothetical protein